MYDTEAYCPYCSVAGCSERTGTNFISEVKTFRIPTDPDRRRAWISAINRKNWNPGSHAKVCSKHFISGKPSKMKNDLDWVPSIFPVISRKNLGSKLHRKGFKRQKNCNLTSLSNGNMPARKRFKQDSMMKENFDIENLNELPDDVVNKERRFTYGKLCENLLLVKKPNHFWGVTTTDNFIIFSRWNDKYTVEKRVLVESNLNIKVFLGELEINIMNLMEFTSINDVSALLEKVESFPV